MNLGHRISLTLLFTLFSVGCATAGTLPAATDSDMPPSRYASCSWPGSQCRRVAVLPDHATPHAVADLTVTHRRGHAGTANNGLAL